MADAPKRNAAGNTKVIGSDSSGNETNYVNASANLEQFVVDRLNNGGEDSVINVTAGTPVEIKVGASPRTERKLVLVQPDGKILFGFSNTTQSFRVFKNQIIRDGGQVMMVAIIHQKGETQFTPRLVYRCVPLLFLFFWKMVE